MKIRYQDFLNVSRIHWPQLTLILLSVFLCILNYTPGAFLSGWDTLHPEFNFQLNFQRVLFGVFRPEQGLGAIAAHSHMADLPRMALMWLVNSLVPLSFLRFLPVFLMLILGPLGMFYLVRLILKQLPETQGQTLATFAAFIAGLWYLCNLGTVQQFVVPFEMFVFEYGFLPWLFFFAIAFLTQETAKKRKGSLFLFALISFFASPMAYASTLWYMYFGFLCLFLLLHSLPLLKKRDFKLPKRSLILILVTLLVNMYWLLPNIYFLLTQSATIQNANINKLFSDQAFLYNKEFGKAPDIMLLKSFFFDWSIFNGRDFEPLLKPWSTYLQNPLILAIGFLTAGIAIVGLVGSFWKKYPLRFSLLGLLFFLLIFLFNDNPPTSILFHLIEKTVPILEEALRFPHNKVQVLYMLIFAIYLGLGTHLSLTILSSLLQKIGRFLPAAFTTIFSFLLLTFFAPAFTGELISPYMRITIPSSYFSLFEWMNAQKGEGRAAVFPIHSFWGWEYHNWQQNSPSFQGAGFLWFGMKQPLLHRDFDRWSPYNEQAYREFAGAVYAKNPVLLTTVAKKYNTQYFILDSSIIAPDEVRSVLYLPVIEKLLNNKTYFVKKASFGNFLSVYEVKSTDPEPVGLLSEAHSVSPSVMVLQKDAAFGKFGHYISYSNPKKPADALFPFRSVIDNQGKIPPSLFSITQDGILIKPVTRENSLPPAGTLSYMDVAAEIPATITLQEDGNTLLLSLYPLIPFQSNSTQATPLRIETALPKEEELVLSVNQKDTFSIGTDLTQNALAIGSSSFSTAKENKITLYAGAPEVTQTVDVTSKTFSLRPCEALDAGQVFGVGEKEQNAFNLFTKNTPVCLVLPLSQLFPSPQAATELLLTSEVTFSHEDKTGGNDNATICVADTKNGSCIHYLSRTTTGSNSSSYHHQFFTGISKNELQTLGLRIALESPSPDSLTKATFARLTFSLTKPTETIIIPPSLILDSIEPALKTARVQPGVLIPYSGDKQLSQDLTTFPKASGLCQENPLVITGKTKRRVITTENTYIRYESENIPQCDHFSYLNNPHNIAHLLLITSRNVEGLPLTICVTNRTSKRCDAYARTTKSKTFITDAFLVPPTDSAQDGYDININNLGVRETPAVNDLASIQLIPFPLDWLSSLSTRGSNQKSTLTDLPSTKLNQHKYLIKLPENLKPDSILTFNASYNSGWIAYKIVNGKLQIANRLKATFPFFFSEKLNEHVLVDNWANGWALSPGANGQESQSIIILFWPQYLFYLGLVTTASTLLFFFVRKRQIS